MRSLGVDTSSTHASVAIVENGRVISERLHRPHASLSSSATHSRNNHAEVLIGLIESALGAAAISLSDISAFAVTIGPGSFTGLRIGLSTVKGLAYGSNVPVAGVSTLHAAAARISDLKGLICAILDARKNEVYAAIFRCSEESLDRLTDDAVMPLEKLIAMLRAFVAAEPIVLTGSGAGRYGEALVRALGNQVRIGGDETLPTVAAAVALLGAAQFANGAASSPVSLAPQYLRPPEAEVKARKLA